MKEIPSIADVVAAKARLGSVPMAVFHSHFSYTWLASYVRLVEIEPAALTTLPVVLAHALWHDPSGPQYTPDVWLPSVALQPRSAGSIQKLIEHAVSDIQEAAVPDDVLLGRLSALRLIDVSSGFELQGTPGGPKPAAPRRDGPTYQMMWQSAGRFFFLEIHNES